MAKEPKKAQPQQGLVVTTSQAAALIGRSDKFIQNLTRDGYIPQIARGQYQAQAVIRGVIAYYEDKLKEATKSEVANKASIARTREIELRTAERARKLVAIDDSLTIAAEIAQMARAEFAGFPARISRDMELRRQMETAIDDIFERLARKARERGEALRSGRVDLDAVEEN